MIEVAFSISLLMFTVCACVLTVVIVLNIRKDE